MKLLIVGLGSMGKRRARLLRGLVPQVEIAGVDSAPARREEVHHAMEEASTGRWSAPPP